MFSEGLDRYTGSWRGFCVVGLFNGEEDRVAAGSDLLGLPVAVRDLCFMRSLRRANVFARL